MTGQREPDRLIDGYVSAASLASRHALSPATVRRRIQEGHLFPGAKKQSTGFGERWLIPREEAEAVSLRDLSPRLHEAKQSADYLRGHEPAQGQHQELSLEERVSRLEQMAIDLLAKFPDEHARPR